MANLGQYNTSVYDYVNSPMPKLGEVNIQESSIQDKVSSPRLAGKTDFSEYADKPWYDDVGAVAKSIGKGAAVDLPEMVGRAAQALSTEDSAVSSWGKNLVNSAKSRAKDWEVDMRGRGDVAKAFIGGGEMLAPSLAVLPTYLAGPLAGAAATVALYGGSQYQDVYDRSKAAGLSDEDAHKAGLLEGAIESGGELISNQLSLGLLGAGRKAAGKAMGSVVKAATDKSIVAPYAKALAGEVVGENLTEGLQQYGESQVEGKYGIGKAMGLGESFQETIGPTTAMSALLAPFGLAGHYRNSQRAQAISNVLDNPEAGSNSDRLRVVQMLHNDAIKAGVDKTQADTWAKSAFVSIANKRPIDRGVTDLPDKLPDTTDKATKDMLPTGEKVVNKDVSKAYEKYNHIYGLTEDPTDPNYLSGYNSIKEKLNGIISPEGDGKVDPIKAEEAKKTLEIIESHHASKVRQYERNKAADEAANKIEEEAKQEADSSKVPETPETPETPVTPEASAEQEVPEESSQIDPEELKRLLDEDTGFNEEIPQDLEQSTGQDDTTEQVPPSTPTVPGDSAVSSQVEAPTEAPTEEAVQPPSQEAPGPVEAPKADISSIKDTLSQLKEEYAAQGTQETQAPVEQQEAPKQYSPITPLQLKKLNRVEQFDNLTQNSNISPEDIKAKHYSYSDRVLYHRYNPNGVVSQWNKAREKLFELVDQRILTSGHLLSNDISFTKGTLDKLSKSKRVNVIEYNVAIKHLKEAIDQINKDIAKGEALREAKGTTSPEGIVSTESEVAPVTPSATVAPTTPVVPTTPVTPAPNKPVEKKVTSKPSAQSEIHTQGTDLTLKVSNKFPSVFHDKNEVQGKVVAPILTKTGKISGYQVVVNHITSTGSIQPFTVRIFNKDIISKTGETKQTDRVQQVTTSNKEVADASIVSEQLESEGNEVPEDIKELAGEPIQTITPGQQETIDNLVNQMEDLRDQLDLAEPEDRKEIRSQINSIKKILESLGVTERQKTVKYTTPEDSESISDEDYIPERVKDDIGSNDIDGFSGYFDESGSYDFDMEDGVEFRDESLTSLLEDSWKGTLKVLDAISFSQKAKNKYMFVKAKLKEVNASTEEQRIINNALETLGQDGKWDWQELVDLVYLKLSTVSLDVNESRQSYAWYGVDTIFPGRYMEGTLNALKWTMSLTGTSREPLEFKDVSKLRAHDLDPDSIAHLRSVKKDGIFHIIEVQSDVKQEPSIMKEDRAIKLRVADKVSKLPKKTLTLIRRDLLKLFKSVDKDLTEIIDTSFNSETERWDAVYGYTETLIDKLNSIDKLDVSSVLKDRTDYFLSQLKAYRRYASRVDSSSVDVYDQGNNATSVKSSIENLILEMRGAYSEEYYKDALQTDASLKDPEYTRLTPYIEKRAIREYIRQTIDLNGEDFQTFRLATLDTMTKVESWNQEQHSSLMKKYAELSKAMAKEYNMKEVTDEFGNTWYEATVADTHVQLAYDLTEKTDAIRASNIKENKALFDKFLKNMSDSVKSQVKFHFIENFNTYTLWQEKHGFSSKAASFAQYGRGIYHTASNGSIHIFINGSLSPSDFAGTFIHETIGHFGARRVIEMFSKEDPNSPLSKYDRYLVNLINSTEFLRNSIADRYERWSNYYNNHINANRKKGESVADYFSRLKEGTDYINIAVTIKGEKQIIKLPAAVAARLADEHIAELAKELYFNDKFIESAVGYGAKDSDIRVTKRSMLNAWLKNVITKIKYYTRMIFGDYVNTVTDTDMKAILAKSFDSVFNVIEKDMFIKQNDRAIVNDLHYDVPITEDNIQWDVDLEESALPEKDISSSFLLTDINYLQKFIDNVINGYGNHTETTRSRFMKGLQEKLQNNSILSGLTHLKNMKFQDAYIAISNIYKGQIAKVEDTVKDMAKVMEGLDIPTNDAVFEYFTTKESKVEDLKITPEQKVAVKKAKDAINELGRVSAELGLIPPEVYEENKDCYLHTMYLKYLDQYRGSGKSTSIMSYMKKKKTLTAGEKAALGQIKDVRFLVAETIGVIGRDHVLINMFNTISKASNRNSLFWTLTNESKVRMPWDNRKTATIDKAYQTIDRIDFIVDRSKDESKVTFDGKTETISKLIEYRNIIKERIEAIEDKALAEAHAHAKEAGITTDTEKHEFLRNHYVRMPNKAKYGLLRNQWVRKEIYEDLDVMTSSYDLANKNNIEKFFAQGGTLERINRAWKISMVALNPGSWVRNIAGNFALLDLSTSTSSMKLLGMLHSEISSTIRDKKPSEFWKLASEYGLFGTTFSAVELQDMYSKYGDELESARVSFESRTGSSWDKAMPFIDERYLAIGKMMQAGKELGHRTTSLTSKAYALVEGAFKTVSFKDYIQTWEAQNADKYPGGHKFLEEHQQRALYAAAAAHANEAIFDYSQLPSMLKTLRRIPFGAPFLTFTYKAGPASIRAMINHPVKFAKYATLPMLLTMIAMATNDWDDKDIRRYKSRLPEYYRNNPGVAFLPFKDSLGRPQILPLDYILPWSQWATAARKVYDNYVKDGGESPLGTTVKSVGTVFNEFGFLGGPTPTAIAAMLSGKDNFTGRSIITPGASADQQLWESMKFTYDMAAPAWISSHGWFSKMYDAFYKKETNQFGELRFTPAQAASDITGFRTISVLERGGLESRKKEFEMRLREISTYRAQIIKDRNETNKISKLKDIATREKMVRQQMREALNP